MVGWEKAIQSNMHLEFLYNLGFLIQAVSDQNFKIIFMLLEYSVPNKNEK